MDLRGHDKLIFRDSRKRRNDRWISLTATGIVLSATYGNEKEGQTKKSPIHKHLFLSISSSLFFPMGFVKFTPTKIIGNPRVYPSNPV
jgi:hypothetical protein